MSKSFLGYANLTRGIRNNNPGNIKKKDIAWLGKITPGSDPTFEQFTSIVMGLRASMTNLRTYYNKYGLNTIRQIINRWAPGSENNTNKYINNVAGFMSVSPNSELDLESKSTLINLTKAIVRHECGPDHEKITHDDYLEAYDLLASSKNDISTSSGSVGVHPPLSLPSLSPAVVKKPLNWFAIVGVLVTIVCVFLLFKK